MIDILLKITSLTVSKSCCWRISKVLSFILILLLSESFQKTAYKHHRFDKICHETGKKSRMTLGDSVHIFSYNSSTSLQRNIKCHLELAVTNSLWGFNIYIQDISLEDASTTDECSSDNYLQFGRDILFVTTHLSNKICDNNTVIQDRHYTEIEDTEMDVWLVVTNKDFRSRHVIIVVTPVLRKRQCHDRAGSVHMCHRGHYCIDRQLRCDGWVNCVARDGRNTDETGCVTVTPDASTQSKWSDGQSNVLIYSGLCLLVLIVVGVGYYRHTHQTKQQQQNNIIRSSRIAEPPLLDLPPPPSCPPPPYTIESLPEYCQQPPTTSAPAIGSSYLKSDNI